ncbi:protein BCAP isoform X7 [Anser cygnoides]|uniref:protein BCAP isoform X7 n=1 Tax=Anser cygnoides TaxID=8845 RepID=UPI002009AA1D|nr:protein BCAP isoform X7 [Anser cygnoides]
MSSSPQAASALPAPTCTAPFLDSELQEKFFLADVNEGKLCVVPITSGEAGKLCSLIQLYKDDYYRTTNAIQSRKYVTDLSKESDRLEHQLAEPTQEEIWKQSWAPCPDKYRLKITELSPLLKKRSPKNHLQQSLNESASRRQKEHNPCENGALQEVFEADMEINSAEDFMPTFKDVIGRITNLSSKNIDALIQKLSQNETRNANLRRRILEREKCVKELSSMLQFKKINVLKEDHISRLASTVEAHLQCQIQRKGVENEELKLKIQTLEKKIAEYKLQVGDYKHQILALRETSEQEKTGLRKAITSQKRKAAHFEEAVKNLTSRIREHVSDYTEVKLSEILSASDVWKKQHDRMVEEKTMLEIQTEDRKKQITSLSEDLKRKEEYRRNSNEEILGKLNSVNSENEKIYRENEKLKVSLATLENSTGSFENEMLGLQEKAKLQENLVEQCKIQVQKLQTEVEGLKSRCETVLKENKRITENKCLEVDEVKDKIEAESKELEHVCDILNAAEEKLQEFQEKLMYWERINAQKCKNPRELHVQEEDNVNSMDSHSLEVENFNIQKKYEDLKRKLEKIEFQNEELAYQLKKEDESLQCSKLQLEEKIAEYNGLTRQLESALEEGKKMVAEEFEKLSYTEQALETKILLLESELREWQEEKKQLLCRFHHNEKHHEICLKELENSLQKSENKNQSIQSYVQFLKTSYITMFG